MKIRYLIAFLACLSGSYKTQAIPNTVTPYTVGAIALGAALGLSLNKLEQYIANHKELNILSDKEKAAAQIGAITGILTTISGICTLNTSNELYKKLINITQRLFKKGFFGKKPLLLASKQLAHQASSTFYQGLLIALLGSFCSSYCTTKLLPEKTT